MKSSGKWDGYRNRTLALMILIVASVFLALVLTLGRFLVRYTPPAVILIPLFSAWVTAAWVIIGRYLYWRCPRCGKPFAGGVLGQKGFLPLHCANCGERAFAEDVN